MTTAHTAPARIAARCWQPAAATLLDPQCRGTVRLLGGPGTGVTSLLVDVAAARIGAGVDPDSVLLLTGGGKLRTQTRSALTTALLDAGPDGAVVRAPLVRSVHAYAFAVLRLAAARAGDPPPRLITSAEQDGIIRELLAGDVEDGAAGWPAHLHPALRTAGFATELRDLLSRCAERGVDARELQRLGRRAARPEWTAAGRFALQYEQVMLLRSAVGMAAPQATVPALSAAELVGAALDAFALDGELLAAERARIRVLLVDDAQQLDPQAAQLVRLVAGPADLAVFAGDPARTAFGFRGADPALLVDDDVPAITLTTSHRCAPAVAAVVDGLGRVLPGRAAQPRLDSAHTEPGAVSALLARSEHAEAALIADTLRRAHLQHGVPWSQMAVIVRSVARTGAGLPRVLSAAGVPVAAPAAHPPLADNPTVRALLTVLTAAVDGLDAESALQLLTGPIGRVDPVSLRQLRRALRRIYQQPAAETGDLVRRALDEVPAGLASAFAKPLRRVKAVLDAARADSADPRATLWQAWQRTGLQRRLVTACERGGDANRLAGQDLDCVTGLFDVAEQFVSRTPGATVSALVEHVHALRLSTPATEPVVPAEEVAILSPHQALDREWDLVLVAGLQDGLWPNTIPRGGVLGTQRLLDVLDGVPADASDRAPLLADERRLLIAAVGRARHRLVVTAVDGDGDGADLPSAFFTEIARHATAAPVPPQTPAPVAAPRVLSTSAVVGRLRSAVCAPEGAVDEQTRVRAALQLARLAAAGVPGAHPDDWYGLNPVSSTAPLWEAQPADGASAPTVTMSPSTLAMLQDCPLRWLLERHGGSGDRDLRSALGTIVHALISVPGAQQDSMLAQLDAIWDRLPFDSAWYARNELVRHRAMIERFVAWRYGTRDQLTEVGTEMPVEGVLEAPEGSGPPVRVRGRADRVERDRDGRLVIVDIKTGKSPVTKADAQQHAQLAMYQLGVAEGLLPGGTQPGGGRLVYLGKPGAGGATEREQDPLTDESRDQWRTEVHRAAAATAGPQFVARVNRNCAHCPVQSSCPAHNPSGEQA